jgi:hypothetical protein
MSNTTKNVLQNELDNLDELIELLTEYRDGCNDADYLKISDAIDVINWDRSKILAKMKQYE